MVYFVEDDDAMNLVKECWQVGFTSSMGLHTSAFYSNHSSKMHYA